MNGMETNGREGDKRKSMQDIHMESIMEVDINSEINDASKVESHEDPISGLNESLEENNQTQATDDVVAADSMPEILCTEIDHTDLEKSRKKPDKLLPCPRCNSLNTKFCYYNNHNTNQPRHFCRSCQRYWTAGGTMRNIPVGAGRRKNKHSTSHYRHLITSSGKPSSQLHVPNQGHHFHDELSSSAKVTKASDISLRLGSEGPLHESDSYDCNVEEKKLCAEMNSPAAEENVEESASASSLSASDCEQNHLSGNATQVDWSNMNVFHNSLLPFIPFHYGAAPPWSYSCNTGWNITATASSSQGDSKMGSGPESNCSSHFPWNPYFMMPRPAFCATTVPFPFVPPPFWGYTSGWPNGTWSMPWPGYNTGLSPSSSVDNGCSYDNPHPLGKHSRDVTLKAEDKQERSLWIPKTLRIDDPNEAAKSSIWKTLGIQPVTKGGMFGVSQAENENRGLVSDSSEFLHANPAALSRSQAFRESA